MSHAAEGEIHAWLDGALDDLGEARAEQVREHLRRCPECQDALTAEEAVRARAAEVLGLAAPMSMELPPLEALIERARRVDAPAQVAAPSVSRRTVGLGWAASVVLALGAGWTAQAIWLRRERPTSDGATVSGPRVAQNQESSTTSSSTAPIAP